MTEEVLKLALEALDNLMYWDNGKPDYDEAREAITAIKEALAQPEQEPRNIRERWNIEIDGDNLLVCLNDHEKSEGCHYERYVPATTTPPQRTWVGLTDWEINYVANNNNPLNGIRTFARAIEAKLKEKNTRQDGDCKHCVNGCPACDARRQSNVLP